MRTHASSTWIGVFVITGFFILIGGLITFGARDFFAKKVDFVLYFKGSVNGLDIGAPVKFRGVQIGEVKNIIVTVDPDALDIAVPVFIQINPKSLEFKEKIPLRNSGFVEKLIQKGLRAELNQGSIVTGKLFVDMDFKPYTRIILRENDTGLRQIPTLPSHTQMLSDTLSQARVTLLNINTFVKSQDLADSIKAFKIVMQNAQQSLKNVDKTSIAFRLMMQNAQQSLKNVDRTSVDLRTTVNNVNSNLDPLSEKLWNTLDQFSDTMNTIKTLTDYLARHPEALIQGKGKPQEQAA